jgi:hypothetical protein
VRDETEDNVTDDSVDNEGGDSGSKSECEAIESPIDPLFPRLNQRFLGEYPLELGWWVCVSVVVLLVYYSEATVLVSKDQANL